MLRTTWTPTHTAPTRHPTAATSSSSTDSRTPPPPAIHSTWHGDEAHDTKGMLHRGLFRPSDQARVVLHALSALAQERRPPVRPGCGPRRPSPRAILGASRPHGRRLLALDGPDE